jgi:CheY-like chemotaxis protein
LNEQLEQRVSARTEELRALNKELEAFSYAVAHDLRAPLRHIHGFAQMLSEEAKPVLTDSCKHHLDMILDSVQQMGQLLEELLRLSRLGRQELYMQLCDLKPLVEEVLTSLKSDIKDRQVEWRIADLPLVECDPALFRQVLVNLLSNALKFTRSRHPAIIEIGQTTIDGEPVIFIRDNGVGFSMKYMDKLFGVFQRLHRQQDFEGTGVGLAIVQRIMSRHGGRVWAEAELDKGATFYLSLSLAEQDKKSSRTPKRRFERKYSREMNMGLDKVEVEILLAEDNEKDIELTLHALRGENLSNPIRVVHDGEEALEFLADCERQVRNGIGVMPKLILLDLKLPKIDGMQVLRQIKSNPITQIIPVVVLTSSKEDEDMVRSYRLGVNSYLQKPVNFEQFRKMVKELGLYWLLINQLPSKSALKKAEGACGATGSVNPAYRLVEKQRYECTPSTAIDGNIASHGRKQSNNSDRPASSSFCLAGYGSPLPVFGAHEA